MFNNHFVSDYQQNRFLRAAAQENTFAKETEPLLPVLDEDTRALFEQKNLLISNECLILGEIIGQGYYFGYDHEACLTYMVTSRFQSQAHYIDHILKACRNLEIYGPLSIWST